MTPKTISLEVQKGLGVQKIPLGSQNPKKLTFWAPKNEKNDFFSKKPDLWDLTKHWGWFPQWPFRPLGSIR